LLLSKGRKLKLFNKYNMYISVSSGGNILSSIDTKNWSFQNLKLPINDIFFKK